MARIFIRSGNTYRAVNEDSLFPTPSSGEGVSCMTTIASAVLMLVVLWGIIWSVVHYADMLTALRPWLALLGL